MVFTKQSLNEFLSAAGHSLQAAPAGTGRHAAADDDAVEATPVAVDEEQEEEK